MAGLISLMQSRKFWLALLGFVGASALFYQQQITAAQYTEAIVGLVAVLIGGIALEDAATKLKGVSNNPASGWQYDTRARGRATGEISALKPEA